MTRFGTAVIEANIEALNNLRPFVLTKVTNYYRGRNPWLMLYGGGESQRRLAVEHHLLRVRSGAIMWDLGYFSRPGDFYESFARVTLDEYHPWRHLDATPNDDRRWRVHKIKLRDDYDPQGHVVIIGMGAKSRSQLNQHDWEAKAFERAKARFPGRRIVYRPKRREFFDGQTFEVDEPIEAVIKGAALVICRHSNVAVDACIAGIPVECEDGAAYWLYRKHRNPTYEQRLDFLHRLAYWQYRLNEMGVAWAFIQTISQGRK